MCTLYLGSVKVQENKAKLLTQTNMQQHGNHSYADPTERESICDIDFSEEDTKA